MTFKCMNADKLLTKIETMAPGETVVYFTGDLAIERERERVKKTADLALISATPKDEVVVITYKPLKTVNGTALGVLTQRRVGGSTFDYQFTKSRDRSYGR